MTDSILVWVREKLGPMPDVNVFDDELMMSINAAFSVLWQLGIGPETPFTVTGETETWDDFLPSTSPERNLVQSYIYFKTRLAFDPPQSSSVLETIKATITEYEWRLRESNEVLSRTGQ